MSDETLWAYPPDELVDRHGEFSLTVVQPPFPGPDGVLGAHDAVGARAFAEEIGTVDRVLEDGGVVPVTELFEVETRADLGVIRVGRWSGGVTEVNDPALVSSGSVHPGREQAEALAVRFPDAVVVVHADLEAPGADYTTCVIIHPSGARVFAAGFSGEGDWDVDGDVSAVMDAFGVTPEQAADVGVDPDDEPGAFAWGDLARCALKAVSPTNRRGLDASVFRVQRSEQTVMTLEDTWFESER